MKYFRLIFKVEDNQVMFSDVMEQEMSESDFQQIVWDKPIIRHNIGQHIHFLSLDSTYLEAMLAGIDVYQNLQPKACKSEKCCKK